MLPYFLGNGERGVYLAASRDGLRFERLAGGKAVLNAPAWRGENLTRDPSILFHNGVFHMVWTTGWNTRSFGYARSRDLVRWSKPRKIAIWGARRDVRNTWAPELHWDAVEGEYLIVWSSTTKAELDDKDGTGNPHGYDHRSYATRTRDFVRFSEPRRFYSTAAPERSVIDPFIAKDDRGTLSAADDRWIMVIKNEQYAKDGGKNLCLVFADAMQGPYSSKLGPPIVGAGTAIVDRMVEGPSLLRRGDEWWLYFDAPGSEFSYCLATSRDLVTWINRSQDLRLPIASIRHGTVLVVPEQSVGWPVGF